MCYSGIIERQLSKLKLSYDADPDVESWDLFHMRQEQDPKRFPNPDRTWQYDYAPVMHLVRGKLAVEPMRFGIYPRNPERRSGKEYNYNARSDNLNHPYWSEAYRVHHGFVALKYFFEKVVVGDLVKDGQVALAEAQAVFDEKKEARHRKVLAAGKKYKPTKFELSPTIEKKIEIQFIPEDGEDLLVPVIFSSVELPDGELDYGFAMITDPATPDIEKAGHERRPIVLDLIRNFQWCDFEKQSDAKLNQILRWNLDPRPLKYRLSGL